MKYRYGDMTKLFGKEICFVTTNSQCTRNGLIMGGGIAISAKRFDWRLPKLWSETADKSWEHNNGIYGLIEPGETLIGAFQTKTLVQEPSKLHVISVAAGMLAEYAAARGDTRINLNFPGIGLGGLHPEEVIPLLLLAGLPDNVFVWRWEKEEKQ